MIINFVIVYIAVWVKNSHAMQLSYTYLWLNVMNEYSANVCEIRTYSILWDFQQRKLHAITIHSQFANLNSGCRPFCSRMPIESWATTVDSHTDGNVWKEYSLWYLYNVKGGVEQLCNSSLLFPYGDSPSENLTLFHCGIRGGPGTWVSRLLLMFYL